jgi:SAM-dependent methyltransferase
MKQSDEHLRQVVKEKYAKIANEESQVSDCCDSVCCGEDYSFVGEGYEGQQGYVKEADLGLGCGLPTEFARIKPGQTVVDLGSGAGNDVFIARNETGDHGRIIGLDFTQEMIERARFNNAKLGFTNVEFVLGGIEKNPLPDNVADVVVSNCVFNLVPDKKTAFAETFRILRPGGHFSISDIVIRGDIPDSLRTQAELYAGCVSGAVKKEEYLGYVTAAGFRNIEIQKEREIVVPDEILDTLSPDQRKAYDQADIGIYSITVYAERPCC